MLCSKSRTVWQSQEIQRKRGLGLSDIFMVIIRNIEGVTSDHPAFRVVFYFFQAQALKVSLFLSVKIRDYSQKVNLIIRLRMYITRQQRSQSAPIMPPQHLYTTVPYKPMAKIIPQHPHISTPYKPPLSISTQPTSTLISTPPKLQPPPTPIPKAAPAPAQPIPSISTLNTKIDKLEKQIRFLREDMEEKYQELLQEEEMTPDEVFKLNEQYDEKQRQMEMENLRDQWPVPDGKRSCTNLLCCGLLSIFVFVMFIMGLRGWVGPKFQMLRSGLDAEGKSCGGDHKDYPYVYFVSPNYDTLWRTVCVKHCPTGPESQLQCLPNKHIQNCNPTNSPSPLQQLSIYATRTTGSTICLPTDNTIIEQRIKQAVMQTNFAAKMFVLARLWPILVGAVPLAIFLAIGLMAVIVVSSKWVVYGLLGLAAFACPVFGVYLLQSHQYTRLSSYLSKFMSVVSGVFLINLGVIIVIGLICYRYRIKLICDIVKISALFIRQNPSISILPFLMFSLTVLYLVLAIFEALGYYSLGTPYHNERQLPFQHFIMTLGVKILMVLHVFHLLWMIYFFMDSNDFIISGAVVDWYCEGAEEGEGEGKGKGKGEKIGRVVEEGKERRQVNDGSRLWPSVWRFGRFHMGSVAMGSFLNALFGLVKFLYCSLVSDKSYRLRVSWADNARSIIDGLCCCCINYVFNCLNSGTYSYINLYGRQYCTSSIDILCLKMKQVIFTPIISYLDTVFTVLIKIGITALTSLIAYLIINYADVYRTEAPNSVVAVTVVAVTSFVISSFFVSIFSTTMEAIYVCFLVDNSVEREGRQRRFEMFKKMVDDDDIEVHLKKNQVYGKGGKDKVSSPQNLGVRHDRNLQSKKYDTFALQKNVFSFATNMVQKTEALQADVFNYGVHLAEEQKKKRKDEPVLKALRMKKMKEMFELKTLVMKFQDAKKVPGNMGDILGESVKKYVPDGQLSLCW